MKRAVYILVAPLRLISRSIAMLAAALLLIGAWGVASFMQTAQVTKDAIGGLTVAASAVAASIDVPLGQFADMTDAVRAADLQIDKVVLTGRLLRLQGALPPVGATFRGERVRPVAGVIVAIHRRGRLGVRYRLVPPRYRRQCHATGACSALIPGSAAGRCWC